MTEVVHPAEELRESPQAPGLGCYLSKWGDIGALDPIELPGCQPRQPPGVQRSINRLCIPGAPLKSANQFDTHHCTRGGRGPTGWDLAPDGCWSPAGAMLLLGDATWQVNGEESLLFLALFCLELCLCWRQLYLAPILRRIRELETLLMCHHLNVFSVEREREREGRGTRPTSSLCPGLRCCIFSCISVRDDRAIPSPGPCPPSCHDGLPVRWHRGQLKTRRTHDG